MMELILALRRRDRQASLIVIGSHASSQRQDVDALSLPVGVRHAALQRLRFGVISPQSGTVAITRWSRHAASGCAKAPSRRHNEQEQWERCIGFHACPRRLGDPL